MSDLDLLDDSESLGVTTHGPSPHADASGAPVPRWAKLAETLREARGLPPVDVDAIPGAARPDYRPAGVSESDFAEQQALAGSLAGQTLNRMLRQTYGKRYERTAPPTVAVDADHDDVPKHRGIRLDVGALWRTLKRLLGRD